MNKIVMLTESEVDALINKSINSALEHLIKVKEAENVPAVEEYLERKEVSKILIVSLSNWAKNGVLIPTYFNTRVRYLKSDILKFSSNLN